MEGVIDYPAIAPRGVALVAHPHPLYGGTMDNKVAVTLMRTFVNLGYVVARINFRGVGKSEGVHDHGKGETDDMAILHAWMTDKFPGLPVALSGFSFGTYVQTHLPSACRRRHAGRAPGAGRRAAGNGRWPTSGRHHPDPRRTRRHHPLIDVLDWLRPQDIPVIVIPGADHFFHRKLGHIKSWVTHCGR
jgi:alpha/beta superfamily hydrolase